MHELSPIDWATRPFKKYASFSGRAPRAEYWWFYLATMVVQIPLRMMDKLTNGGTPFSSLFTLATLLPWLGVTTRRLHDTGRSGWWLLGFAIALVGGVALMTLAIVRDDRTAADFTVMILFILLLLGMGVTFLVFMVLPGTPGPNRYGSDPYGPDQLEEVFV